MSALKENNIDDNTLVIFTADNGPWLLFGEHGGSTAGLRGQKTMTWEGGHREPSIMRWSDVIPKGTVNNELASNMDFLPTFTEVTGASFPEKKIDGVSILPLLKGEEGASPRDHMYCYQGEDLHAVHQGKWKLVFPHKYQVVEEQGKEGRGGEIREDSIGLALYNTRNDAGERYDVKDDNPEVVKELEELAKKAREDLGDGLRNKKERTGGKPDLIKMPKEVNKGINRRAFFGIFCLNLRSLNL